MAVLEKPARVVSQSLLRLQSDTRLAELARDGHEPAFDALVRRYQAELIRASSRIVGPDRCEDAVQQALLNAHRAIDTTENVQNLRAWLHKIGHNSSLNTLRAIRDEAPLDAQHATAASAADPAVQAELSERLRETLAAIDDLPDNQRAALLLRELEGRSHEDIAAALGLTAGAARQQLMRARQGVRQAVTALTPYPLVAALCAPNANAGVAELLFGAGASATAAKLGASVAATGAIAGGVFGASVAVQTHETSAAGERSAITQTRAPTDERVEPAPVASAPPADRRKSDDRSGHRQGGDDRSGRRGGDDRSGPRGRGEDRSDPGRDRSRSRSGRPDPGARSDRRSGRSQAHERNGSNHSGDNRGSGSSRSGSGDSGRGSGNGGRGGDD